MCLLPPRQHPFRTLRKKGSHMARTHSSVWRNSFMQPHITRKGALYSCDCAKCGTTIFAHEWASPDFNEDRDAMANGTFRCHECSGFGNHFTFRHHPLPEYAARLSAPGYMDCTNWSFSPSKRRVLAELVNLYGN